MRLIGSETASGLVLVPVTGDSQHCASVGGLDKTQSVGCRHVDTVVQSIGESRQ